MSLKKDLSNIFEYREFCNSQSNLVKSIYVDDYYNKNNLNYTKDVMIYTNRLNSNLSKKEISDSVLSILVARMISGRDGEFDKSILNDIFKRTIKQDKTKGDLKISLALRLNNDKCLKKNISINNIMLLSELQNNIKNNQPFNQLLSKRKMNDIFEVVGFLDNKKLIKEILAMFIDDKNINKNNSFNEILINIKDENKRNMFHSILSNNKYCQEFIDNHDNITKQSNIIQEKNNKKLKEKTKDVTEIVVDIKNKNEPSIDY